MPYLYCRCGIGSPPDWVQVGSGALLGFLICFKPHFALVAAGVELLLFLRYSNQSRWLSFAAFIISGALQVVIFLTLFDIAAYFHDIADFAYYNALGVHYEEVVAALLRSRTLWLSVFAAILALGPLFSAGRLRPFAEASILTAILGIVLAVLQGTFREYYLILIYLPLAGLLVALICCPRAEVKLPPPLSRILPHTVWVSLGGFCLALFAYQPDTGILRLAGKRYLQGYQYHRYGGIFPDPFAEWVNAHIAANVPITVISPQYGEVHSDPVVSMLHLGRAVGSHTGANLMFSIAEADGEKRSGCEALDLLRRDIIEN